MLHRNEESLHITNFVVAKSVILTSFSGKRRLALFVTCGRRILFELRRAKVEFKPPLIYFRPSHLMSR
jgi:hypothetical protein